MANKLDSAERKKLEKSLSTELFDDPDRFEMWFAANWKKAALAVLGVIIVLCIGLHIWRQTVKQEKQANHAIAVADTIETLQSALAANPKAGAANFGRYRLAQLFTQAGKYAESDAELTRVVESGKADSFLDAKCRMLVAANAELSGDFAKSAALYQAIGDDEKVDAALRAEADCSAVRLYLELKDFDRAKAVLAREYPGAVEQMTLAYYLDQLKNFRVALDNGEFAK